VVCADRPAEDQRPSFFEGAADQLAAGNLADPRMSGVVLQDDDIAGEEREMRAAEVEQHAVAAGNRETCMPVTTGVPGIGSWLAR